MLHKIRTNLLEIILVFFLLFIIFLAGYSLCQDSLGLPDYETNIHIVQQNETLWDLAIQYASNKDDIRDWIHHIQEINNIHSGIIYPGDRLIILAEVQND